MTAPTPISRCSHTAAQESAGCERHKKPPGGGSEKGSGPACSAPRSRVQKAHFARCTMVRRKRDFQGRGRRQLAVELRLRAVTPQCAAPATTLTSTSRVLFMRAMHQSVREREKERRGWEGHSGVNSGKICSSHIRPSPYSKSAGLLIPRVMMA